MNYKSKKSMVKRKSRKILLWCFSIFFFLFTLLSGFMLWITASLFDHKPFKTVNKNPDYDKIEQIAEKIGIIQKTNSKQNIISQYATMLMQDVKIVELSDEEVNTLFAASLTSSNIYLDNYMPELTIANCQFKNGTFIVDSSFENSFSTPFGKYLNMHIVFTPQIRNRHLSLKIESVSVGTYKIAGAHIQDLVNEELSKFEESTNGKDVLDLITTLYVEKQRITIVFKPKEVLLFIGEKAGTAISSP